MKMFKKFAVVMLAVAVLFTMTVPTMAAASNSPAKKTFTSATLKTKKKTTTYTGKTQKPAIKTVKVGKTTKITAKATPSGKVTYKSSNKKVATVSSKHEICRKESYHNQRNRQIRWIHKNYYLHDQTS